MKSIPEKLSVKFGNELLKIKFINAVYAQTEKIIYMDCIFPRVLTEEEKTGLEELLFSEKPAFIRDIKLKYKRSYADENIVKKDIMRIFRKKLPALAFMLTDEKIQFQKDMSCSIVLNVDESIYDICEKQKVALLIKQELDKLHCDDFLISLVKTESKVNLDDIQSEIMERNQKLENQFVLKEVELIDPTERVVLIGQEIVDSARLIADIESAGDNIVICGKVESYKERVSKQERVYWTFDLIDFSGKMACMYFPTQKILQDGNKILSDGMQVIIKGSVKLGEQEGDYKCMVRHISSCLIPEVCVEPPKKVSLLKEEYEVVFPQKVITAEQINLMESARPIASDLIGKRVVVFDIETTGLDADLCAITEIAGVLLEDGIIRESFSTLVNPEMKISEEITKLTGIDDAMVENAPTIQPVIGDFHKFTRGCVLVAHNIGFDKKFIDKYGEMHGYIFDNEKEDTYAMARERVKGLTNYKLNTLTTHFNIELEGHHRALNDTMATAKLYMELKLL